MGIAGMALPWQITIATPARPDSRGMGREKRPEKHLFGSEDPAGFAARSAETRRLSEMQAEDSALAAGCRSGRLGAYEELYQVHGVRLKSLAMNLLGNRHDAEDAVQETFLKVHRGIGSFKGQSSFATWVYRILVNTCYDARRKKVRRQEMPEQHVESSKFPEAPAPAANHPLRMAIERSLARLSEQQRDVFLLAEVEGFKHAEIGGILGISEAASKNALFQAKKHLRQMLAEPGGVASPANR